MIYLFGVAIVGYFVFRHTTRRGKRFVRAINFLECLDCGATLEEANQMSGELFTNQLPADMEEQIIHRAIRAKDLHFNGKQLPAIRLAVSKGFEG